MVTFSEGAPADPAGIAYNFLRPTHAVHRSASTTHRWEAGASREAPRGHSLLPAVNMFCCSQN